MDNYGEYIGRPHCWVQGRQCGSMNNIRDGEEPAYERKQDTHREKQRDRHKEEIYSKQQQLQNNNQPLLKVTKSLYIVTNLGQLVTGMTI